jgi:ABC-type nitrate/sulfonate/bicarbonate transport system substrate-binding protein
MNETTRPNLLAGAADLSAAAAFGACATNKAGTEPRNNSTSESTAATANVQAKTNDIPINSAAAFAGKAIVMTQPRSGEFKVFNS